MFVMIEFVFFLILLLFDLSRASDLFVFLVELCSYVFVRYGVSSMTLVCWSVHRCKYHSFLCKSWDTIYAPRARYVPSMEGEELVDEDGLDIA